MKDKPSKRVLRWVWIVLIVSLFVNGFVILYFFPNKLEGLLSLAPYFTGLITIAAGIAFGGSHVKRLTEATLEKSKNGGSGNENLGMDEK